MSAKYEARHLLIKFSGSRNPVSRRTGESTANVSGEAAMAELQTYIDKIAAEAGVEPLALAAAKAPAFKEMDAGSRKKKHNRIKKKKRKTNKTKCRRSNHNRKSIRMNVRRYLSE